MINVPPPSHFASFGPSELFRFFFQIGHWTEDSFSDEFQTYTRGKLVSTVSINKWKNKDVIPTRYSVSFFKLIEGVVDPSLAKDWVAAFETVWALHSAGRTQSKPNNQTLSPSDTIVSQHRTWIKSFYAKDLTGETFAPLDVYVPLQLIEIGSDDSDPKDTEDIIDLVSEATVDSKPLDWIYISGGPGSGKSMTASHLANAFCDENIFPIYLRGSRLSNIDIDITDPDKLITDIFSPRSFLRHFRASSFDTACLILDGLDEIAGPPNVMTQLISDLKNEQAACATHHKKLVVIALGRNSHTQFISKHTLSDASKHFELLSLDGKHRGAAYQSDDILGEDLRPVWWEKYLTATGNMFDPSLPDFLTTEYDDFSEFGSDPLLTYLVCHTVLKDPIESSPSKFPHERVNKFTYTSNRNAIYGMIVQRLAEGVGQTLDSKQYLSILQHMALATWHEGGGRSVPLDSVYNYIEDQNTKVAFQTLNLSDNANLRHSVAPITAFYYRLSTDGRQPDQSLIEFTHKTFSEYLLSTLIFDRFVRLITTINDKDRYAGALREWAALACKGAHSPSLAGFCQKEAALRYESLSYLDWNRALKIIRNDIEGVHFRGPRSPSISEMQNASSLLYFVWSCLNLERQKRTDEHYNLSNTSAEFSTDDLKSFQRPNGLSSQSNSLVELELKSQTFLTHTLSALHLKSADMSQLSFSLGHIENLICEDSSFAMTHWSHVKVTMGNFIQSVFQQVIFHQWRVFKTHFTDCFFQGSQFRGGIFSDCHLKNTSFSQCHFSDVEFISPYMENVVFDRCVFAQCAFPRDDDKAPLLDAQFRHCTFIDMDTFLKNIPKKNIKNTIVQNII